MSLLLDYSGKNLTKTEIEATVAAGVIKNFDPNTLQYYCVVCSRNGCGDILPHLLSKEHRNSLIWEAVRQSPPSPAVLQLVPEVVRNAKLRNEVGAVDKNHFSYRCQICVVKKPFNGVAPLEAHLNGKEHEKSKRNMQFTSMPHQTPFLPEENSVPNSKIQKQSPPPPPSPHSSLSSTQPGQVQITKQPISLPFEMGPGLGLGYNRPNRQYLHEADNIHQGTTSVEASQYPHWSYPTHHLASQFSRMSLQDPAPNRSLNTMFGNMQPLSPEAEDAVRNGIVSEGEMSRTGPAYYCNSCRVPLTGARPLVQHVEGEKHKKNVLAASYRREPHNKLFPNVRFPDLKTADSRSLQALPSSTNPEGPQDLRGMNSESPSTNNETSLADRKVELQETRQPYYDTAAPSQKSIHSPLPFDPGQLVLIDLSFGKRKVPAIPWDGPYLVQSSDENVCLVQKGNGKCKTVPREYCILYTPQLLHTGNEHLLQEQQAESHNLDLSDPQVGHTSKTKSEPFLKPQPSLTKELPTLSTLALDPSQTTQKFIKNCTVILGEDGEMFVCYFDERSANMCKPSKLYHSRSTQTDVVPIITCDIQADDAQVTLAPALSP